MPSYTLEQKLMAVFRTEEAIINMEPKMVALHLGAAECGASISSVRRWCYQWCELNNVNRRKGSGRKKKLNPPDEAAILAIAKEHPYKSCVEIIFELDLDVSRHTVRRYLKSVGILRRVVRRKAFFSPAVLQKRLDFCHLHADKDAFFWDKLVYLDEVGFSLDLDGRLWIHRTAKTAFDEEFTLKCKGPSVCMKVIYIIVPHFNFVKGYILDNCKQTRIRPWENRHRPIEKFTAEVFMRYLMRFKVHLDELFGQDDYQILMDFAAQHVSSIPAINALPRMSVFPFVQRSQDWNIIENFFSFVKGDLLKRKLTRRLAGLPTNYTDLRELLRLSVRKVVEDPETLLTLSGSMPDRLLDVIEQGGHACKY